MMAHSHALTGWCIGLAVAPLLGQYDLAGVLAVGVVCAGFALLPDLDHRGSTASRLLGPVTAAVSWVVRTSSRTIYSVTKGRHDEPGGEHRTFWHTGVGAAVLGSGTGWATAAGGGWAVLVVLLVGVLLAVAAIGDLVLVAVAVVAGMWLWHTGFGPAALAQVDATGGWLGYAVAIGCLVHDLGDALTEHGCPILFPLPIAGETYYELRLPEWLRFSTGGRAEHVLVFVLFTPMSIALIPGVWPVVWPVIHPMISAALPG
jgi:LexA-binding, inner membrane-associated putative hydrolase